MIIPIDVIVDGIVRVTMLFGPINMKRPSIVKPELNSIVLRAVHTPNAKFPDNKIFDINI